MLSFAPTYKLLYIVDLVELEPQFERSLYYGPYNNLMLYNIIYSLMQPMQIDISL